jgi:hypothetical protein
MEDFIPILLLVAWLLITFYSKKKKLAAASQARPPIKSNADTGRPKTLEEIILAELGSGEAESRESEEAQSAEIIEEEVQPAGGTSFLGYDLSSYSNEAEEALKVNEQVVLQPRTEEPETETEVEGGFDLRRAIVLSTVLERPYL